MEIHELALLLEKENPEVQKPALKFKLKGRLKASELKLFAETLSRLLHGGVPILKALDGLERASPGARLQSTLTMIREKVTQGSGFSEALEKTGRIPSFFHQIVYAGEVSGRIPEVLEELARYLEKDGELKRKLREALVYPGLVLGLGFVTLGVLLGFVLPKLQTVYRDFGTELPEITKMMLGLSDYFVPLSALLLASFGLFVTLLVRNREALIFLLYRLPVAGTFVQGLIQVQFSRLISLLLESGIPVLQAIEIVGKTFDAAFLKKDMESLKEKLTQGRGFSQSLEEVIWMDSLSRMLASSGEESGRLGASLSQIAKDTQAKLEAQIQMLVKLLEPAMILAVGLLVGIVVIATVLPIFDMSGIVQ